MHHRSFQGFGPVGTNSPKVRQLAHVNFAKSHVGDGTFIGTVIRHFMDAKGDQIAGADEYASWIKRDVAVLEVYGLQDCAIFNSPNSFSAFMQEMVSWARDNANVELVIK